MTRLDQIFEQATKLFFNAARNSTEASGMGISFSNSEFPKEAYQLIKANFPNKLSLNLIIHPVTVNIAVEETISKEKVFKATLNYDKNQLIEYLKKSPSGSPGFLVLGVFFECKFYVINSEQLENNFQPFQVEACFIHDAH